MDPHRPPALPAARPAARPARGAAAALLAGLLLVLSAASPRKKGVVNCTSFSGLTPGPWSRTLRITQEPERV